MNKRQITEMKMEKGRKKKETTFSFSITNNK
jgi:hypothetical protein